MANRSTLVLALWGAVTLLAAGVAWDLRWHAVHGSATDGGDVVAAHWLAWAGITAVAVVARRGAQVVASRWYAGYLLLLAASLFYAAAEGAHLWGHAAAVNTTVLHILMTVAKVMTVAAACSATVLSLRDRAVQEARS